MLAFMLICDLLALQDILGEPSRWHRPGARFTQAFVPSRRGGPL
jgi:hypothetical protein